MSELQLQMNFAPSSRGNRFRDILNSGEFMLLVENSSPGRDNDPAAAAEKLAARRTGHHRWLEPCRILARGGICRCAFPGKPGSSSGLRERTQHR